MIGGAVFTSIRISKEISECNHDWKNDEMFESGCVTMITNDNHPLGEEMRQICSKCGKVRYITKEAEGSSI